MPFLYSSPAQGMDNQVFAKRGVPRLVHGRVPNAESSNIASIEGIHGQQEDEHDPGQWRNEWTHSEETQGEGSPVCSTTSELGPRKLKVQGLRRGY